MTPQTVRMFAIAIGLMALIGCRAETDREQYTVGDLGVATFINGTRVVAYLGGCSTYSFEKLEAERWTDRGPAGICVWEGFAQPVEPGTSRDELLIPGEMGTWRLRYSAGLGCLVSEPLNEESCEFIGAIYSSQFSVVGVCDPAECGPPLGMPNWLCPDGESIAGPTDRCLEDPEVGQCGWEIADCPD
jgi:hypothetical protein